MDLDEEVFPDDSISCVGVFPRHAPRPAAGCGEFIFKLRGAGGMLHRVAAPKAGGWAALRQMMQARLGENAPRITFLTVEYTSGSISSDDSLDLD